MFLIGNSRYLKDGIDKIIKDFMDVSPEGLKRKEFLRLQELEHEKWIKENGYILIVEGVYYTEQDILDGKVPYLNGTLVNMGYLSNSDGTWRKKLNEK